MGEYAEALREDEERPPDDSPRSTDEYPVWTTREGKRIRVSDMTTSHIENALAMLKRNGVVSPRCVAAAVFTEGPSGDSAHDAFIQECNEIFGAPSHPAVDWFTDELARRE